MVSWSVPMAGVPIWVEGESPGLKEPVGAASNGSFPHVLCALTLRGLSHPWFQSDHV